MSKIKGKSKTDYLTVYDNLNAINQIYGLIADEFDIVQAKEELEEFVNNGYKELDNKKDLVV